MTGDPASLARHLGLATATPRTVAVALLGEAARGCLTLTGPLADALDGLGRNVLEAWALDGGAGPAYTAAVAILRAAAEPARAACPQGASPPAASGSGVATLALGGLALAGAVGVWFGREPILAYLRGAR